MYIKVFQAIKSPYSGLSRHMWCLLVGGFVNAMSLAVTIYISLGLNDQGYAVIDIGKVLTAFGVLGILGGYCGGALSDKYSAVKLCKLSLFASSILFLSYPFFENYYAIVLISALLGFFSNLFRPAFILSLTYSSSNNELENHTALRRVAINLGMAFGASFCGLFAEINNDYVFWFNALSSFIALVVIYKLPHVKKTSESSEDFSYASGRLNGQVLYLLLVLLLVLLVLNQSLSIFPLFLKNTIRVSEKSISLIFTLNGLMIALFQVPITRYLKDNFSKDAYIYGAVLICLGFGMNAWFKSYELILFSALIWTIGEMIFFPAQLAKLIRTTEKNKGLVMGFYQVVTSLSQLGAPIIGASLLMIGDDFLWYCCAIVAPLILLISLVMKNKFNV